MKKSIHFVKYVALIVLLALPCGKAMAQAESTDTINKPAVLYSAPKRYEIAGITVSGIDNYEDYVQQLENTIEMYEDMIEMYEEAIEELEDTTDYEATLEALGAAIEMAQLRVDTCQKMVDEAKAKLDAAIK